MCSASLLLSTPVETVKGRRPHTKLQQRCLDLAGTLPPLTEEQRLWARSKMAGLGYYVVRGYHGKHSCIWCQECGQIDEVGLPPLAVAVKIKETNSHVCSRCGRKLEVKSWNWDRKKDVEHNFNFCIVTTCDGMQVVRVFNWHQSEALGRDTVDHIFEAFQVWFEPNKGKEVILSKDYTRSWYHFRWHMYSEWKVKQHNASSTGYYSYEDVYSLENKYIYPRAKILPILKRNGWSNRMFRMRTSPVDLWRGLLTDPAVEALAKTGQYNVIDYWYGTGGHFKDKSVWMPIVRICNRHHYVIKDASMWFDYIDLLNYFHKDTRNPHYVCPENLKHEHDRLMDKKTRIEKAEELKRQIAQAEKYEKQYKEYRGMFFGICFGNEHIAITVICSVKEMAEEGTMMHHCVYANGYYDHTKHPNSLILSAKDKEGHRLETIELNTKTWKVIQSRALQNGKTKFHDEIVKLVEQNIGLFKKAA